MPSRKKVAALTAACLSIAASTTGVSAQTPASILAQSKYVQTNLVSNVMGQAVTTDPNLIDA